MELLFILPLFTPLSSALTGTHTLQYFYTAVPKRPPFPELTATGLLDGEQIVYYDSSMSKMIPKTEWIRKVSTDDPQYWDRETRYMQNKLETFQDMVIPVMQSFHHDEGDHVLQRMFGCKIDDGTNRAYDQYGYDGEDFIGLDLITGTWNTSRPQAENFIQTWDPTQAQAKYWKDFLTSYCIYVLKKLLDYGREAVERKDRPEVSVFHKHSPSPEVVCHATGFFPETLMMSWQKDGEDMNEDVNLRETLPNPDGSFQKRIILTVPAEELQKHTYTCVVQHSSLEKDLVLCVRTEGGRSDGGSPGGLHGIIVGAVVVLVAAVAGIVVWKMMSGERRKEADVLRGQI